MTKSDKDVYQRFYEVRVEDLIVENSRHFEFKEALERLAEIAPQTDDNVSLWVVAVNYNGVEIGRAKKVAEFKAEFCEINTRFL